MLIALAPVALLAGCGGASTGALHGRIVGPDNAGVRRTALVLKPLESGGRQATATTNARGGFTFADVKKGRYRLSVAYNVSGVFQCTVRFPVEILAGKTVLRRLEIPVVDVEPNGTAKLSHGRKTKCRTLADPLAIFLCQSARPLALFTLPPRDPSYLGGYRRLGRITGRACHRLRVLGRIRVPADLEEPFGWLYLTAGGKRGWANPEPRHALSREVRAWQDVAVAKAKAVPLRAPTLPGKVVLPDLAFTTPRAAHHEGEACDPSQFGYTNERRPRARAEAIRAVHLERPIRDRASTDGRCRVDTWARTGRDGADRDYDRSDGAETHLSPPIGLHAREARPGRQDQGVERAEQ